MENAVDMEYWSIYKQYFFHLVVHVLPEKGLDQARLHLTLSRQLIRIVVDSRAALSLYIRKGIKWV